MSISLSSHLSLSTYMVKTDMANELSVLSTESHFHALVESIRSRRGEQGHYHCPGRRVRLKRYREQRTSFELAM